MGNCNLNSSLENHRSKCFQKAKDIVINKATNITWNSSFNRFEFNYKKSDKFNKHTVRGMINTKIKKFDEWLKENYNSKFHDNWLTLGIDGEDVFLYYRFNDELTTALRAKDKILAIKLNKKALEDEARQNDIEDAKRSGREYTEDYGIDYDLPEDPNYNYTETISIISNNLSNLEKKIKTLQGKGDKDIKTIEQLKGVKRKLKSILFEMRKSDKVLENFFEYFHKNLNTIDNMLKTNPNITNLLLARDFMDSMKFMMEGKDKKGFSNVNLNDLSEDEREIFEKFIEAYSILNSKLESAELKVLEELVDGEIPDDVLTDYSFFEYASLALGVPDDSSSIEKAIRERHDEALSKQETFDLRQKLLRGGDKVAGKLKEMGETASGLLGRLSTSVKYDIFKNEYNTRLISPFSNEWEKIEGKIDKIFTDIYNLSVKKDKTSEDYKSIEDRRRKVFNLMDKNTIFLDPRKIPEVAVVQDFAENYKTYISKEADREAYKKQIINHLITLTGSSKLAEQVYKEKVEELIANIHQAEVALDADTDYFFNKNGVNSLEELKEKNRIDYNKLASKANLTSPFSFYTWKDINGNIAASNGRANRYSNSRVKYHYIDEGGEKQDAYDNHTMEGIVTIPKTGFHNSEIDEISKSQELTDFYLLLRESLRFINKHRKDKRETEFSGVPTTLVDDRDFVHEHKNFFIRFWKYLSKNLKDWVKNIVSSSNFKNPKGKLKVKGSLVTIEEVIKEERRLYNNLIIKKGLSRDSYFKDSKKAEEGRIKQLKQSKKKIKKEELEGFFNHPSIKPYLKNFKADDKTTVGDFIEYLLWEKVVGKQRVDLVDSIIQQLEAVEKYKASKEVEEELVFINNMGQKHKAFEESPRRKEMMDNFIIADLYEIKNRKNWNGLKQNSDAIIRVYKENEKELVDVIDTLIKDTRGIIENLEKIENKEEEIVNNIANLKADIKQLKSLKESKGRVITTGSIIEAIFIKGRILASLGLNFPTQAVNYTIGQLAGFYNDGIEWRRGNFYPANMYTRRWRRNTIYKGNYALTEALVNTLNIFQNSANEIEESKKSRFKSKIAKYMTNPLEIVSDTEKAIQRPQILAMLNDVYIYNEDKTKKVPIFDGKNLKNPHPAFELVDGILQLKKEFDTEENRATWIKRNSVEYTKLFSDSGKIPSAIARIHGDYRNAGMNVFLKRSTLGGFAMLFKTWYTMAVLRKYSSKTGIISKLIDENYGLAATAITTSTTLAAGLVMGGFPMVTVPMVFVIHIALVGINKYKKVIERDVDVLQGMLEEIRKEKFNLMFLTSGFGAKAAQVLTGMAYKPIVSGETVDKAIGFKPSEDETEYEKSMARLQYLLAEAAMFSTILAIKMLAAALVPPDDERDYNYKKKSFTEKIVDESMYTGYLLIENLSSKLMGDMSVMVDPGQNLSIVLTGAATPYNEYTKFTTAAQQQWRIGDIKSGANEGSNRIVQYGINSLMPKGLRDGTMGFSYIIEEDKTPNDFVDQMFDSDFKKAEKVRTKLRDKRKEELSELDRLELLKIYRKLFKIGKKAPNTNKKVIQSIVDKEIKSISKYFEPSGKVKKNYRYKVDKYLD